MTQRASIADLPADVNERLAWIARQPIPSTKKLEREIANEDRHLAAKRERLRELRRAGRRPNVKSVKEKDVVAALGRLRELLRGDVGVAAQVLTALVGDVVIETRQVEGREKPQLVARFTINAVPALAVLERRGPTDRDGVPVPVWDSIHASPSGKPATTARPTEAIVPLVYDRKAAARRPQKTKCNS